jgi:hypothetical protein
MDPVGSLIPESLTDADAGDPLSDIQLLDSNLSPKKNLI